MADYSVAPLAYLKLVLHAAKFPSSTCVGLLVGTISGSSCAITDAIPLLHHWTDLSPMAEAGLGLVKRPEALCEEDCPSHHPTCPSYEQAELYAKQQQLVFLGLYVANERLGDQAVPHSVQKMVESIRRDRPEAVVLVVDDEKLASSEPALIPYLPPKSPSASWQPTTLSSARISLADPSAPTKALEQVRQGRHKLLGDFDEHLEDVGVDWLRNAAVAV
ncbi:uncharacterized conserved protein encodedby sequence overlapping the COX4 gene [Rhodotorula toruloides]|uniref:Uncharacterized conserved protein encodedby sequence overlapping the COX4 protein n=1 Tax=Rhodotorula toruloides TaxID=5286 RepID=A0A511K7N6_RHOTO|nr:uncharacterized conserved protein encodedby sequence overlapping the COX4 gene [Rhodotorula toruloides]